MGCCAKSCVCLALTQLVAIAVLLALIPTGYLTFEYYLKPWGEDQLRDYAKSAAEAAASAGRSVDLSGVAVNGTACVKCPGMNAIFPITSTSHPSYGGLQRGLMNNGGWATSMLTTAAVVVGGGGSVVVAILSVFHGISMGGYAPTSSTSANGCGIFEMALLLGQGQFLTMLGSLQLKGLPMFFLEFCKKMAWTNLQIFPRETSYHPSASAGASRHLLAWDAQAAASAKGVERYALLVGVTPDHLFYYTCIVLAVVLAGILFVYLFLRLMLGAYKKEVASSLDHRVIWLYFQLFLLGQYIIAMTSSFQIYYTIENKQAVGNIGLAVAIITTLCLGVMVFGIVKIARHREELSTHGTDEHDDTTPFHLRYSVFYQDFTVENLYFFVAKMLLDIACGAIIGTVSDPMVQIGVLIGLNVVFLIVLIWRQPYLIPLFYYVTLVAGYLRVVLLLLTLVQAYPSTFPQEVRDFAAVLIIGINLVLILCILVRQFYVLSVAIYKWASRKPRHKSIDNAELGIPLQDMTGTQPHPSEEYQKPTGGTEFGTSNKTKSSRGHMETSEHNNQTPPTSSQPYYALESHSPPRDPFAVSDDTLFAQQKPRKSGRRSLYSKRRSAKRPSIEPPKDDQLPSWARV